MNLHEALKGARLFRIRQRKELAELIGFETRNKYEIQDGEGKLVGFAAEQQKGVLGFLGRQVLGHWRKFDLHVFDSDRKPLFIAKHPFRWLFQRMEIFTADGKKIGNLQSRFSILHKRFDLEDASGRVQFSVRSPIWRIWTFPILRRGVEEAVIRKKWSGLLKESFTDSDNFEVELKPEKLTVEERALILIAAIFVDMQYFERKAR